MMHRKLYPPPPKYKLNNMSKQKLAVNMVLILQEKCSTFVSLTNRAHQHDQ